MTFAVRRGSKPWAGQGCAAYPRVNNPGEVMRVVIVEKEAAEWDAFVQASPGANAYHRFGWSEVFTKSFGHKCYYLAALDELGEWQGILPLVHMRSRLFGNFLVSLPYVNYGGLLCATDQACVLLLEAAEKIRSECGAAYIEMRHVTQKLENLPTKQNKVSMILALSGSSDTQWNHFNSKLRNQIRKSQKSGLEFRCGRMELLDDFYEVFAQNMRDLGTPVYAKKFFCTVLETFPETTMIGAVYFEGIIIAAGLLSWFRKKIEIPWASSNKFYNARCPNHMLYWQLIELAIERKFSEFDFGRSTLNEGTYNFKKQWGALPMQLNWQYQMDSNAKLPHLSPDNPKYRLAIRAWQHLPIPITKIVGPWIVRSIP